MGFIECLTMYLGLLQHTEICYLKAINVIYVLADVTVPEWSQSTKKGLVVSI